MSQAACPDVAVYVCCSCVPQGRRLPRQWHQDGAHVVVHEIPCSGKIDAQYMLHTFEGGGRGVCLVACPKGECHLAQGNYRAEVRIRTVQRMLTEIGLESGRAELIHFSPMEPVEQLERLVRDGVTRICKHPEALRR